MRSESEVRVPARRDGWLVRVLVGLITIYQRLISPVIHSLGGGCRFYPSCSVYAVEVLRKDGILRGTIRALGRLLRCHPLHPGGLDPP